jgi:hypothetical protein
MNAVKMFAELFEKMTAKISGSGGGLNPDVQRWLRHRGGTPW